MAQCIHMISELAVYVECQCCLYLIGALQRLQLDATWSNCNSPRWIVKIKCSQLSTSVIDLVWLIDVSTDEVGRSAHKITAANVLYIRRRSQYLMTSRYVSCHHMWLVLARLAIPTAIKSKIWRSRLYSISNVLLILLRRLCIAWNSRHDAYIVDGARSEEKLVLSK